METILPSFAAFRSIIKSLPSRSPLLSTVNRQALTLADDGQVSVLYAPFEHRPASARLIIVGITPGIVQAEKALLEARRLLLSGAADADALRGAKLTASFSGSQTRANLVAMLDAIGAHQLFGLASTSELFKPGSECVHFTSALRYPVFVAGQNYNGSPHMIRTPLLRATIERHLAEEVEAFPDALWLPLGPKPALALNYLVSGGKLRASQVLDGIPHPSGLNGERVAAFLGRKAAESASPKTDVAKLLAAFAVLRDRIVGMKGESA